MQHTVRFQLELNQRCCNYTVRYTSAATSMPEMRRSSTAWIESTLQFEADEIK